MMTISQEDLATIKQDLIREKQPNQTEVEQIYTQLISKLATITSKGISDDKYVVLFNDTLSICLLRYRISHESLKESESIFDYILQLINHPFPPLQNSLNSLIQKLLNFEGVQITQWIDKVMKQSLTKSLYLLLEVLLKKVDDKTYFLRTFPEYPENSIKLFDDQLSNCISKTLIIAYGNNTANHKQWYTTWKEVIKSGLSNVKLRANVITYLLPNLLKINPKCFELLVAEYSANLDILIPLLNMGQKSELIDSLDTLLDSHTLINCLVNSDHEIRLNSLQLLLGTTSKQLKRKPIPKHAYEIIQENHILDIHLNDSTKQDIFISIFYQFISGRFSDCLSGKFTEEDSENSREFLSWLLNLLLEYLDPGSTFPQTIGVITILSNIQEKLSVNIFNQRTIKSLAKHLFSDYKAIRNSSLELLEKCPAEDLETFLEVEENGLFEYSEGIVTELTGRVSEGAAKAFQFLAIAYFKCNQLERLDKLESQLLEKIVENEVYLHGYFSALNLIVEKVDIKQCTLQKLIEQIFKIWKQQKSILSREVTTTEEDEDISDDDDEGYSDVNDNTIKLHYSWKVAKTSNELMISMLEKYHNQINPETILDCTKLVMDQLSSIKHRGAFSSIYPSFIKICKLCFNMEKLSHYPKQWIQDNIQLIESKTQLISRRSGGIPYLIAGVLVGAKSSSVNSDELFKYSTLELLRIAKLPYDVKSETKRDIPQVHAYNTLKQIFIEGSLANDSVRYIEEAMMLALENFCSENWSIRNCAVMLFGSIKQRSLGAGEAATRKTSSKLFFSRFPKLKTAFLDYLLKSAGNVQIPTSDDQVVFPILIMLSQLEHQASAVSSEFATQVQVYLGRKEWKIREMAARTMTAILSQREFNQFIQYQLQEKLDLNNLHGVLLCAHIGSAKVDQITAEFLLSNIEVFVTDGLSYFIKNAYINVLANIELVISEQALDMLKNEFEKVLKEQGRRLDGGKQLYLSTLSSFVFSHSLDNVRYILDHVEMILSSKFLTVQMDILEYISREYRRIDSHGIADLIWKYIETQDFHYALTRALKVYSLLLEIHIPSYANSITKHLINFLDSSNLNVKLIALECLAKFPIIDEYGEISEKFLSWCDILSEPSQSLDSRQSAHRAITSYMTNSTTRKGHAYFSCLMLSFERGLIDENYEIRQMSTRCLSQVCGFNTVVDCGYMINYFPTFIKSISDPAFSKLILNTLLRNTIDQDQLKAATNKKKGVSSLYSEEKIERYLSSDQFGRCLSKAASQLDREDLEVFSNKVVSDFRVIAEVRCAFGKNNGWLNDDLMYEIVQKSISNGEILLGIEANDIIRERVDDLSKMFL
ncbi:uncharacterized protein J8A68_004906 [[Candida] subhashii]|uniref:DUF2428 domain-containing protein n=1 Tax=[Candida] subhashii TaxID=561895 RepID=A0A8J5UJ96_9ASCO|nr:uncharacterized protein J8A68_004906 [[Candida] subhashii]KAG7661637.1 hypothetical protein J8A68_004906 [[Candida] subhashii]